jgi:hypothetical protein
MGVSQSVPPSAGNEEAHAEADRARRGRVRRSLQITSHSSTVQYSDCGRGSQTAGHRQDSAAIAHMDVRVRFKLFSTKSKMPSVASHCKLCAMQPPAGSRNAMAIYGHYVMAVASNLVSHPHLQQGAPDNPISCYSWRSRGQAPATITTTKPVG